MLILDGKTDLNQISLTGARAITLIGLLAIAPHSLEEIREKFLQVKIMDKSHSDDILRIDLNTIKSIGCVVSRSSAKTDYKYVLSKHPFNLSLTMEDINTLKRLFDKIKNRLDLSLLTEYSMLFSKIAGYIYDDEVKEALLGISPIGRYNSEIINDLMIDCKYQNTLELIYHKPTSKTAYKRKIIAQKLIFKNDKIYLQGYNPEVKNSMMLNFKHIEQIVSREITPKNVEPKKIKVKFCLKDAECAVLNDEEVIIGEKNGKTLVEGTYFNNFLAAQRILSLGSNCIVEEPLEFRQYIISKLKEMRSLYE